MKPCDRCGNPVTSEAPHGLCEHCLLLAAVKSDTHPPVEPAGEGSGPGGSIDIGDLAEVARRLPQFEILQLVGRGGMGVVYKVRQRQLDRIVAIKILPSAETAATSGFVERFRREAQSLAKLNHPNIVTIYDFGDSNGLFYFVMEFVEGANLRQLMNARRMTPSEALSIVPKICDALQYAHDKGIVHRDMKPENVLVDNAGVVKIADFGLAKLLGQTGIDSGLTLSGAVFGTPDYMSPEQKKRSHSVDHRADIYSLGVVFYELLTGELPLGRFALPSKTVHVDVRLDEVVLKALDTDVKLRYQKASQIRDDIATVTNNMQANRLSMNSLRQRAAEIIRPLIASFRRRLTMKSILALICLAAIIVVGTDIFWRNNPSAPNAGPGTKVTQPAVSGTVVFDGVFQLVDVIPEVAIDGQPVGKGSLVDGFRIPFTTGVGSHQLTIKYLAPMVHAYSTTTIPCAFETPGNYSIQVTYSRLWGSFDNSCTITKIGDTQ